MYFSSAYIFANVLLLCSFALAFPSTADVNATLSPADHFARSANTCADPTLSEPVFQAFKIDTSVHVLNSRFAFENGNSVNNALSWSNLQPAFCAWPTQQSFTSPLFQLGTADRTQYIYRIGADANSPPIVSGFNTDIVIIGWVYDSQVCGSVPLMSSSLAGGAQDRYWTISAYEHNGLVSGFQWTDTGVVAFVLPLDNCL